jgi:hypothetical protein
VGLGVSAPACGTPQAPKEAPTEGDLHINAPPTPPPMATVAPTPTASVAPPATSAPVAESAPDAGVAPADAVGTAAPLPKHVNSPPPARAPLPTHLNAPKPPSK